MGQSRCSFIQQRYVMCALSCLIFIVSFLTRSGIGIVVVAMVNVTMEHSAFEGNFDSGVSSKAPVYNWSRQMQGYILSSYYWGYAVLQVFGGSLAQRYGGKWVVTFGTFGLALLDILTPLSASISPYLMIFVTCMKGVVSGVIWPGVFAMSGRWVPPEETGTLLPLTEIGAHLGQAIGQMYAGVACASDKLGGWPSVFYINGALGLFSLIPWCTLVYNSPEQHPFISSDEVEYIQRSLKSDQERANKSGVPWRRLLLSRGVIAISYMHFGIGWSLAMIVTIIPQYIDEVLGVDIRDNAVFNGAISISGPLVFISVSRVSDFLIKREWLTHNVVRKLFGSLGTIAIACGFFGLAFVKSTWAAVVFIFISYVFYQLAFLSVFLLVFEISQNFCGTLSGIAITSLALGGTVSPVVADTLTKHRSFAEWKLVFYVTSGLLTCFGVSFPIIASTRREEWDMVGNEEKDNDDSERNFLLQNK